MNKAWGHFKTVMYHKYLVAQGCFKVGLYRQGLLHDMSKFSPTEFLVGMKYFQGDRSPNNAEREVLGYSSAWLHHKGRNKHHFEYWLDYSAHEIKGGILPAPMPVQYVIEMFMDRVAASKVYLKDAYDDSKPMEYFLKGKGLGMHPKTRKQLYVLLKLLKEQGEEKTFDYIKYVILNHR